MSAQGDAMVVYVETSRPTEETIAEIEKEAGTRVAIIFEAEDADAETRANLVRYRQPLSVCALVMHRSVNALLSARLVRTLAPMGRLIIVEIQEEWPWGEHKHPQKVLNIYH